MFEDRTFENILEEMLGAVPGDIDKREGSIIYNALAPAARKIAEAYGDLALNYTQLHAQTATGEALRARGADFGIAPKLATPSIRQGLFEDGVGAPFDVPVDSRYSAGGLNYTATEKVAAGEFKLTCETAGSAGDVPIGTLVPIEYVAGLATATLGDVIVPGTDDETDEAFRVRYFARVRTPPTSGNRAAYRAWALEVSGVGDAYVVPNWDGPNTVKVVLLGTDKLPASAGVVSAVKAYIDPVTGLGEGMGEGAAPAGAVTTVVAATAVSINVSADVTLTGSRTLLQVKADFESALSSHFATIAFSADPSAKYARIGTLLLDTPGVVDYGSLFVNGGTGNVAVPAGFVAIKGTVTLT